MALSTTQTKKRNKKIITLSIVAVVLAGTGVPAWYILDQKNNRATDTSVKQSDGSTNTDKGTVNQDAEGKQEFLDNEEGSGNGGSTPQNPVKPPTAASIELSARASGENIVVTTQLSHLSTGTCTLTITSSGKSLTKTADVMYAPEFSTCAGFTVAKNELPASTWSIKLDVTSGSSTASKTITFTP